MIQDDYQTMNGFLYNKRVRQFTVAIDHLVSVNIGLDTLKQLDAVSAGGDIILRANRILLYTSFGILSTLLCRKSYKIAKK